MGLWWSKARRQGEASVLDQGWGGGRKASRLLLREVSILQTSNLMWVQGRLVRGRLAVMVVVVVVEGVSGCLEVVKGTRS